MPAPAFHYRWNGLGVRSPFDLPGLRDLRADPDVATDVTISRTEPGSELPAAERLPPRRRFVLNIPGVAMYVIHAGRRIVVQPSHESDPRDVRLFLMGSAMGALCHQRGLLPLHASAVRVGDECVAFVGPSGVGKSTLAAFLVRAGYPLVSDDVTVLSPGSDGREPRVAPGAGHVKLWRDGVEQLGGDPRRLRRIRGRREKYLLDLEVDASALPLRRIYCIEDGNPAGLELLQGTAARFAVINNVYRGNFAVGMGLERQLFDAATSIAAAVKVYRFSRVRGFEKMADHVALLAHHWKCGLGERAAGVAAVRVGSSA